MCVTCIRSQVDITEGISKSVRADFFKHFFSSIVVKTIDVCHLAAAVASDDDDESAAAPFPSSSFSSHSLALSRQLTRSPPPNPNKSNSPALHPLVRCLRALPPAAQALGPRRARVQGAPRAVPPPHQGRRQGLGVAVRFPRRRPTRRRRVHLDGTALKEDQGQADGAGRSARQRRDAAASLRRRFRRRAAPVHRLHARGHQRRVVGGVRAGEAARRA